MQTLSKEPFTICDLAGEHVGQRSRRLDTFAFYSTDGFNVKVVKHKEFPLCAVPATIEIYRGCLKEDTRDFFTPAELAMNIHRICHFTPEQGGGARNYIYAMRGKEKPEKLLSDLFNQYPDIDIDFRIFIPSEFTDAITGCIQFFKDFFPENSIRYKMELDDLVATLKLGNIAYEREDLLLKLKRHEIETLMSVATELMYGVNADPISYNIGAQLAKRMIGNSKAEFLPLKGYGL